MNVEKTKNKSFIIYTLKVLSLDVICSLWLLMKYSPKYKKAEIIYQYSDWDGAEIQEYDVALGVNAGGKGFMPIYDKGSQKSIFHQLVEKFCPLEDRNIVQPLVDYIHAQVFYGSPARLLLKGVMDERVALFEKCGLEDIFRSLQYTYHKEPDQLIQIFRNMLNGKFQRERNYEISKEEMDEVTEYSEDGQVALVVNPTKQSVTTALFAERNIRALVYYNKRNGSIGVLRNEGESFRVDNPIMAFVVAQAGELNKWFAHPDGRQFSCGSGSTTPTKSGRLESKVSYKKLFKALQLTVKKYDQSKSINSVTYKAVSFKKNE